MIILRQIVRYIVNQVTDHLFSCVINREKVHITTTRKTTASSPRQTSCTGHLLGIK